ncbi:hypothetical protein V2G26_016861 [Clonostachys chloroleuca]
MSLATVPGEGWWNRLSSRERRQLGSCRCVQMQRRQARYQAAGRGSWGTVASLDNDGDGQLHQAREEKAELGAPNDIHSTKSAEATSGRDPSRQATAERTPCLRCGWVSERSHTPMGGRPLLSTATPRAYAS